MVQPDPQAIEALLTLMNLDEKLGQLTMRAAGLATTGPRGDVEIAGAIRAGRVGNVLNVWGRERLEELQTEAVEGSRLGIPILFGLDVLHGQHTIFPIPLAEASAFDPELWERTARAAALETAADGVDVTFAPMLDVARDPRWGRIAESPGEDPWLAAHYGEAKVQGFQRAGLDDPRAVAACAKHLCAYAAVAGGREYMPVEVSERSLHEVYLPPFTAAVDAGAALVMPAFTDHAGVPMTAHRGLLTGWLRDRQGFEGVIVSDYAAVAELVVLGVAADLAEAAALALRAGVDVDMMSDGYREGLPVALERGLVSLAEVDAAVRRVLTLKARLGLLDDPWRRIRSAVTVDGSAQRALAREMARRSVVLLTHRDEVLPLAKRRRLAVLGPLADSPDDMLGPWAGAGRAEDAISLVEALRRASPPREITTARGVDIDGDDASGIPAALDLARAADVVVLALGEGRRMSGEAASRGRPWLPGQQAELARAVLDLDKPVVVVLFSGRPLTLPWLFERVSAVLAAWFPGVEAGPALVDVLCGHHPPVGRLPVTWPVDVGQVPIFFGQRPTGRPAEPEAPYSSKYLDVPFEPQFPFGHGLSYTRFGLADLRIAPLEAGPEDAFAVEVEVTNEGARAGEEVVFLFVRDPVASVTRPLLELKGMQRIALEAGARAPVRFDLPVAELAIPVADLSPRLEPCEVEILVGPAAERARLLSASVRVTVG